MNSALPHWHPPMIDEQRVEEICRRIETGYRDYERRSEMLGLVHQLMSMSTHYGEKTAYLRRVFSKRRNLNDSEIYSALSGIRNYARMQNRGALNRAADLHKFRAELGPPPPGSGYSPPLPFPVSVFVDDIYHGTVYCIVTLEEVDRLRIGPKSLPKAAAMRRKINDHWRFFEAGFPRFVEEQWRRGNDLTKAKQVTWSEIEAARIQHLSA